MSADLVNLSHIPVSHSGMNPKDTTKLRHQNERVKLKIPSQQLSQWDWNESEDVIWKINQNLAQGSTFKGKKYT